MQTNEGSEEKEDREVEGRDDEDGALGLRSNLRAHRVEAQVERGLVDRCPLFDIVVRVPDVLIRTRKVDAGDDSEHAQCPLDVNRTRTTRTRGRAVPDPASRRR